MLLELYAKGYELWKGAALGSLPSLNAQRLVLESDLRPL